MRRRLTSNHLKRLRNKLLVKGLDAILISRQTNRYYLTGWQGDEESGYILVTEKAAYVLTDSRYTEEVAKKVIGFEIVEFKGRFAQFLGEFLKDKLLKRVGFESHDLSVFFFQQLKKHIRGIDLVPIAHVVEDLREVKDEEELELIKRAVKIADNSFAYLRKNLRLGMREIDIALRMENFIRSSGAEKNAWNPFIVASGSNSSMVHYPAGERRIKEGDILLIDWGCVFQGYYCDISRVLFLGEPNTKQREVYQWVFEAQKKAIDKIKQGQKAKEIDLAAREFLKEKTDFFFRHSVGHGVGLSVHELPFVNEHTDSELVAGQVITVEPGIYIPNWGGVRIEDMFLVTEKGSQLLTHAPKRIDQVVLNLN